MTVSRAYSGYIEYVGAKLSAVRPGPPKAWSSCSITSLEPLAAHTCSGVDAVRRVAGEVGRQRGAQLGELAVGVAVERAVAASATAVADVGDARAATAA